MQHASSAAVKTALRVSLKGVKTENIYGESIRSFVTKMLATLGFDGEFTLVIITQARSSGGGKPNLRVRHSDVTGVHLSVRASTDNGSKYDCKLSRSGMKAEDLHKALTSCLEGDIYEPETERKNLGKSFVFPTPPKDTSFAQAVASAIPDGTKVARVEITTPAELHHESLSLVGFTKKETEICLVMEALYESHQNGEFTRSRFYDILRKHKFCQQETPKKALAQIVSWFIKEELIAYSGQQDGVDFYKMTDKGRAKLQVPPPAKPAVVVSEPVPPVVTPPPVAPPVPAPVPEFDINAISAGLESLLAQNKEFDGLRSELAALDVKIAEDDAKVKELKALIDPVIQRRDINAFKAKGIRSNLDRPEVVELNVKLNRFRAAVAMMVGK